MFHRILAATISASLLVSGSAASAHPLTAPCGNTNTKVRAISVSSQVSGENVRVCADWLAVSRGSKKTTSTKKTTPTSTSTNKATGGKVTKLNHSVIATADRPTIFTVPGSEAAPAASVLIFSSATRHSKLRNLLGFDTLIRFTPDSYRWTFGDGTSTTSSRSKHRFARVGKYFLRLSVTYRIAIRVLPSGKWLNTPLRIKKVADPKPLSVTDAVKVTGIPVLVNRNCLQNPSAVGC